MDNAGSRRVIDTFFRLAIHAIKVFFGGVESLIVTNEGDFVCCQLDKALVFEISPMLNQYRGSLLGV